MVSCTFAGGTMTVTADTDGDTVFVNRLGGSPALIRVNNINCDAPPAMTNTTNLIVINDSGGDDAIAVELDLENGGFAPGALLEASAAEIEIQLDLAGAGDSLEILDGEIGVNDVIRAGEGGFNLNAGDEVLSANADADLTNTAGNALPPVSGFISLFGENGNDVLRATGGLGTGAVLSSRGLIFNGNAGSDQLTGGASGDRLDGGTGDDTLDGGAGVNALFNEFALGPVSVDLGVSAPQDTGAMGIDTITNIANLRGGPFGDELTGDAGSNGIAGAAGADTVRGGLGDDTLSATETLGGMPEGDTLAYDVAGPGAGVSVDLNGNGSVSGGQGSDTIVQGIFGVKFVNVIGSPLADTIIGDGKSQSLAGGDGADSITGGLGNDSLFGDAGFDGLFAADGLSDSVACGPDLASFSIDSGLDSVAADCTPAAPADATTPTTSTTTSKKKCKKKKRKRSGVAAKKRACKKKKKKSR